jgi:glutathione S-transferase
VDASGVPFIFATPACATGRAQRGAHIAHFSDPKARMVLAPGPQRPLRYNAENGIGRKAELGANMPMIIYGAVLSPFVHRVVLAARFKGMKYVVTMPEGGQKSPDYLKLNPLGKVPTIKDGKTVLFESSVIIEYLDAKTRTKKLVPKGAKAAATARLIGAIGAEYVQTASGKLFPILRSGKQDPEALEAASAALNKGLDLLERYMAKAKYAAGAKFSIADVYVIPAVVLVTLITQKMGLPAPAAGRPKLTRYLATVRKDKVAGPVIAEVEANWNKLMGG